MRPISYQEAYPGIEFLPRSRNWWAWLKGSAPECVHLDQHAEFVVTVLPDTLYLQGKRALRRDPPRPEISLCRSCLEQTFTSDIAAYEGRIAAFEPDPEIFTQYFFVGHADFEAAGLDPEFSEAVKKRLEQDLGKCLECSRLAAWLWFPRSQVASLDDVVQIQGATGEALCGQHGARKLWTTFADIPEANLFYMNLPYGPSGAYVWI